MYSWTRRVDVRMYVCTYDRWKFASFFTAGHYVIRVYVCMYIPSAVQLIKIRMYVQYDLCEKANDETGLGVHEGLPSDEAAGRRWLPRSVG